MNLYNLNISQKPISILKKAIIFESEKACMQYRSYFGIDRQFQELNDNEFILLVNKLKKLNEKYHKEVNISFIFDKDMITAYKASPTDEGPDKFI